MSDFTFRRTAGTATITTGNWSTTQWIRENAPDAQGTVTGANYATVTGDEARMLEIGRGLVDAGFECAPPGLPGPASGE